MRVTRLVFREIGYRWLGFVLGALSIALAVGCLAAEMTMLRQHDERTKEVVAAKEQAVKAKEAEVRERMRKFEDETRQITVNMGFNLLILPKGQKVSDLYDEEAEGKFMPEGYAAKLAESRVATINHVLPSLTQRIKWTERQRKIMLMGVRGEVYVQSAKQKPILEAVPEGSIVLGSELHESMGLKVGNEVTLLGRKFKVSKLHPERGNQDDVTAWINLGEAQELLGKQDKINAILALECNCEADRLAKIREEIRKTLPDTDVVELATQAVARAEMRNRVAAEAQASVQQARAAVDQERAMREQLRAAREDFAAKLVPVVMLAAAAWVGLLALGNARERKNEIGVLRALGVRTSQVLGLFLGRAALMGAAGGLAGLAGGAAVGLLWNRQDMPETAGVLNLVDPMLVPLALLGAPLLATLASWVPALLAAQEDPAVVLQQE